MQNRTFLRRWFNLLPFLQKRNCNGKKVGPESETQPRRTDRISVGFFSPGVHKGVDEMHYALIHLWMGIVYLTDGNLSSLREIRNNFKVLDDEDINVYFTKQLLRDNEILPVQLFLKDIDMSETTLAEIDLKISRLYLWRTSREKYDLLPLGPLEHLKFAQGGRIFVDDLNVSTISNIKSMIKFEFKCISQLLSSSSTSVAKLSNPDTSHKDSSIKEERVKLSHLCATADDDWDMLFDFQTEYRTRGDQNISVKDLIDSLGLSEKLGYCLVTKRRISNRKGRKEN